MTQDERWLQKYNEVMEFMEKNHRNPSRYRLEELAQGHVKKEKCWGVERG